jgi:hypothetical protein
MHTYSLAFTPVFYHQLLFAVGCLLLKFKRSVLRRTIKAKPYHLAFAMSLAFLCFIFFPPDRLCE